ncbi:uncharacterized protein LOC116995138 [Catharus ustulatus]|uniref:uncharacterized protein LOC116995138 n=1 Tax=Catharus ustulatus TaxID=91951 RepID=UPI00140C6BCC|nr:uncharacterized protein LOC116995138 [Catharus ustulatus]
MLPFPGECHQLVAVSVLPFPGECHRLPGTQGWVWLQLNPSQIRANTGFKAPCGGQEVRDARSGPREPGKGRGSSRGTRPLPAELTRCCPQLRPLFLLALADLLGATALLATATIPLLPAPLSVPAYALCPYGRMLTTTSYAVSFLMVVVYAYESHRAVLGGRARPPAALQERSRCLESARQGIPYVLAWLLPTLTLLVQLLARGSSATDIAPAVPGHGRGSNDSFSLYCSSCLLLIRPKHDICSQSAAGKNVEGKIIFVLYVLLVLGCCSLLYRRVRLRYRGNAALPLLSLGTDGGVGGTSGRGGGRASLHFQMVFLLCWTPGKARGCPQHPHAAGSH